MSWFGFGSSKSPPPPPTPQLQSSISAKEKKAILRREKAQKGPTFSSAKCPRGAGLNNSCELPFGMIWTPMAYLDSTTTKDKEEESKSLSSDSSRAIITCPTSSLPPIVCVSCLAYANPFCKLEATTGIWTCSLCDVQNALPPELVQPPPTSKSSSSSSSSSSSKEALEDKASDNASSGVTGLAYSAFQKYMVEYRQPIAVPPMFDEEDMCTIVLVIDANLDRADAQGILDAMEQILPEMSTSDNPNNDDIDSKHPPIRLGLVVFDQAVYMYQLGIVGVASADVYTLPKEQVQGGVGSGTATTAELEDEILLQRRAAMEQREYLQSISNKDDLKSLSQCLSAVFGGLSTNSSSSSSSATSSTTSRKELLRKKKEARMRREQLEAEEKEASRAAGTAAKKVESTVLTLPNESPWTRRQSAVKSTQSQRRCTGEALQCALDMTTVGDTPSRTSRILLFTNGCPNLGDGSVVVPPHSKLDNTKKTTSSWFKGNPKRHNVVDGEQMAKAIEYFDMTATLAIETGVAVDVFCCGAMELGLPAYQALVEPSGGYVLSHTTFFDSPHLVHNLRYLLQHTYLSRSPSTIPEVSIENVKKEPRGLGALFQRSNKQVQPQPQAGTEQEEEKAECFVDVRCDSYVVPTHMVGPGEVMTGATKHAKILKNERAAFAEGCKFAAAKGFQTNNLPSSEALDLSLTRLRMTRVDPLATLSFMAQVDSTMIPEEDEFAFFQMTSRHVSRDGKTMITRVWTRRLPVAKSVSDFVKHVDDEAVSVLLAKGAVYRSLHGREETAAAKDKVLADGHEALEKLAYDAQLDLDATIQRISGAFRLLGLEEKTKSIDLESGVQEKVAHSSLDFAFPPQLTEGLRRLYHLRRGALISPGPMRSMDDRAEMRQLFLRFPLEDCVEMMAPKLWSTGDLRSGTGTMTPFPPETLALWESSIIAADLHDIQFVWSGRLCAGSDDPRYDEIRKEYRQFLERRGKNRFPMPEVHILYDGDSMSRRFTTRLAPTHADTPDQQLANFPELAQLPARTLEDMRSHFRFYDASSDASFRKWFWSVSSATNASREDGMSLCE